MKITKSVLVKTLKKFKDEPEKLKQMLRYYFSDKNNIILYSHFFFPETTTNKTPDFHLQLYDKLFTSENEALAAPRGHAKSSCTGIIYLTFQIVNKLQKYIVYVSQNHTKTVQFIDPIRHEFKENKWLRFVYGDLTPNLATSEDGRDREDCFDVNGIRIEAVSFEKNLRGFKYGNIRPTLIILDDIEDDSRVLNPELRFKDSNKLNKIIIPSLDINGVYKFIGTILHIDSLLYKKIRSLDGIIWRALDENDVPLWPDRFTFEKLMKIKDDIGLIPFRQEYLNDPTDNETSIIKREWIEGCYDKSVSYSDVQSQEFIDSCDLKVCGVDFAFSDRITADKSEFITALRKDGKYYVADITTRKGLSIGEQVNLLRFNIYTRFDHDYIGLEENSIKSVSKDIDSFKMPITLFWTSANDPSAKRNEYKDYDYLGKRHTVGKTAMILRIATSFEKGKWVLPYKTEQDRFISDSLRDELTSYALAEGKLVEAGVHPDKPIALGYALELINNMNEIIMDFG